MPRGRAGSSHSVSPIALSLGCTLGCTFAPPADLAALDGTVSAVANTEEPTGSVRPTNGAPRSLWPIGVHLGLTATVAAAVFAGVILALWWAAGSPDLISDKPATLDAKTKLDLVKIGLAVVAGIGGLVALVVAFRRQRVHEQENHRAQRAEERENTKLFNERFGAASAQLGHGKAAVRLAGVYALAGLADDWEAQRQTCIDVLCAYLRMPYTPPTEPTDAKPPADTTDQPAASGPEPPHTTATTDPESEREVRATVIRLITAHLRDNAAQSWRGRDFDFTGAVFDRGDFSRAEFTGSQVNFTAAKFTSGGVSFDDAKVAGGWVRFHGAEFTGGQVSFSGTEFADGRVSFHLAKFAGGWVRFAADFTGSQVNFTNAEFTGGEVSFTNAEFTGGEVSFTYAKFTGGEVDFDDAKVAGGRVSFDRAKVAGGQVSFTNAEFTGGEVSFDGAEFTGGQVSFTHAKFAGGRVDLSRVASYRAPPVFDARDELPPGLLLPIDRSASAARTNAEGASTEQSG